MASVARSALGTIMAIIGRCPGLASVASNCVGLRLDPVARQGGCLRDGQRHRQWSTPSGMVDAIRRGRRLLWMSRCSQRVRAGARMNLRNGRRSDRHTPKGVRQPRGLAFMINVSQTQRSRGRANKGGRFFPIIRHNGFNFEKYAERIDSAVRRSLERKAVRDTHVSAGRPMAGRRVGRKSEQFMPADIRQKLRVLSDK